jgi:glycerol-3-phosphate dehydrogenase (NAD(P)+)
MEIAILGCGNWGSVFGIIQSRNGHRIRIWEFDRPRARRVQRTRNNEPFLTGYKIPEAIEVSPGLKKVLRGADLTVFAVPCQTLPKVLGKIIRTGIKNPRYLSLIKGIDVRTLRLPSDTIGRALGARNLVYALSGPSIANEIVRGEPTAVVLVGPDSATAQVLQHELATENFRVYHGRDKIGVELAGAAKNVLAIAAGISDGLGFGANARGALCARGIAELQRLGRRMGGRPETFWGLAGLGDLVTTASSEESRNHRVGRMLGRGLTIGQIRIKMVMVAEGVPTARAVRKLAVRYRIDMPICETVYNIIYEKMDARQGLKALMTRPLKGE